MEVQFRRALKDMPGTFSMGFFVGGEDKEVVHVNDKPSFSDHVSEEVVHESLESCRRVGKSEEYYCWFKEAFVRDEGSFPLVAVLDANIIVPPANVKLSKQFGVFEFVDGVRDEWKGICVSGGMFV